MKRIWIVDDDEEMSRAVTLMLNMLDSDVKSFTKARAAVEKFNLGHYPDLIILDINMPEISGLDMVEFLRRRPETSRLPIVVLSSETTDEIVDKALNLGADEFIKKPVTIEELEKAMSNAFYKHLNL